MQNPALVKIYQRCHNFNMKSEAIQKKLQGLRERFAHALFLRPVTSSPTVDGKKLKEAAGIHGYLISEEASRYCSLSDLSHQRISLLMRFRPQIFGEGGQAAANMITRDAQVAAESDSTALNYHAAAQSFLPDTNLEILKTRILDSSAETSRLVHGIIASIEKPMSTEEEKAFYHNYGVPDDPLFSFNTATQKLSEETLTLARLATERIETTMHHAALLHSVALPNHPSLTAGLRQDAENLMQDCRKTFDRAERLLQESEAYVLEIRP